jgi:hypothetical protein
MAVMAVKRDREQDEAGNEEVEGVGVEEGEPPEAIVEECESKGEPCPDEADVDPEAGAEEMAVFLAHGLGDDRGLLGLKLVLI